MTACGVDRQEPFPHATGPPLFTAILAFGVAATAFGTGVLFILIGLGIRDVRRQVDQVAHGART